MPLFVPTRIFCECDQTICTSRVAQILGPAGQIRLGLILLVWVARMNELQITRDINPNRALAKCLFVAVETLQVILTPSRCIQRRVLLMSEGYA
jgi:hypothetical protein